MKEIIASDKLPRSPPFVSLAVKHADLVFVCGLGPRDLKGDIRKQTTDTISLVKQVLEEAGTSLDNVLKMTVYLSDVKNYQAMNEEYSKFFKRNPPTRTCVQAFSPFASKGQLVEMDAIAAL